MFWEFIEAATGVDRSHIKDAIKSRAIRYVEAIICKCGHPKWQHLQQGGNGNCNRPGCKCEGFQSRNNV